MELDSFKGSGSKPAASDKPKSAAPGAVTVDSDHVTYQLFYRPEQAKFSNTARVCTSVFFSFRFFFQIFFSFLSKK
jgi:hypothetical protein